ncbi:unnamed protein product [Absidia cylindrospora]
MPVSTSTVLRLVNFIAAIFMIVGGVSLILNGGFPNFILGVYSILFGLITILFEVKLPKMITQFASFMFSLLGRSLFYIFMGCIILNYNSLSMACGIIIIIIGVIIGICHFVPSVTPPENMSPTGFEKSFGLNPYQQQPQQSAQQQQPQAMSSPYQNNNPVVNSPYPSYSSPVSHAATPPHSYNNNSNYPVMYTPQQEVTHYPQKTYIQNESHIA